MIERRKEQEFRGLGAERRMTSWPDPRYEDRTFVIVFLSLLAITGAVSYLWHAFAQAS